MEEVNINELYSNKVIIRETNSLDFETLRYYSNLLEYFENQPEEFIKVLERKSFEYTSIKKLNIINFNDTIPISKIRNSNLNKIYKIRGIIKRVTKVIPRTKYITFECMNCSSQITIPQDSKRIKKPEYCISKGCSKGVQRFNTLKKEIMDIQEINLEEIPEDITGRQPEQIRVYVEGDLTDPNFTDRLQPGKRIEVIGIIKELPAFMSKRDEVENITDFMMKTINIINLEEESDVSINEEDMAEIKKISENNPLEVLSNNLAESVYGYDLIKKSIILQLVKGVKKSRPDGTSTKSDIHILIIGDPGMAKSVLLQSSCLRSPRSRYVSGTKSSGVGITASVIKDDLTGSWSVEAGAMILAHKSTLYLDELDKFDKNQLSALYEPLELQIITINKAGINTTLKAETSVLAAANPIKGKFNISEPIASQIDLPPPLLNRFDLIFPLKDLQKADYDKKAVGHLFKIHQEEKSKMVDKISINLFKKYIHYARKLKPKLKNELLDELENIYLKIRSQTSKEGGSIGVPINLRNLEALIRLSEANAKLRLSEFVELCDLKVAEEIFLYSLKQTGYSEDGFIDMSRITEKVPVSKRGRMNMVYDIMYNLSKVKKEIAYHELLIECEKIDIKPNDLDNYLEQLKKEIKIIEATRGVFNIVK